MPIKLGGKPVTGRDLSRDGYRFIGTIENPDGGGTDDLYAWTEGPDVIRLHRRCYHSEQGMNSHVYRKEKRVTNARGHAMTAESFLEDPWLGELWAFVLQDPKFDATLREWGYK